MLASFLDQIPGAFSRRFLISSFLPLALFCVASLLVGYSCLATVQSFADWYSATPTLEQAFIGIATTLTLAAVALVLSGLLTLGRLAMERSWLPRHKRNSNQETKLKTLEDAFDQVRLELRNMRIFETQALEKLRTARISGTTNHAANCVYRASNGTHSKIAARPTQLDKLSVVVDELSVVLTQNSADLATTDGTLLDEDHGVVINLLRSEVKRLTRLYAQKTHELEKRFPGGSTYETLFGQIAGIMSAYTAERYGADHVILWPRLEAVLRKDNSELYAALEDSSMQLDFHVGMFWLTGLFFVMWTAILACLGLNPLLFLAIALMGPLLCGTWYRLAARSYRSLAEQICTAVDLARLKVFEGIGLERPHSAAEERDYWRKVSSVLAFGGLLDAPYSQHEPKTPAGGNEYHLRISIEQRPSGDPAPADPAPAVPAA